MSDYKEILPVEVKSFSEQEVNSVSARNLYFALGFEKAHWARWYKKNITSNPFAVEHVDWEGFTTMVNGNETLDFIVSLDFAKKIAMMTRTQEGEHIRNYFLECEKALAKTVTPKQQFQLDILSAENELDTLKALKAYEDNYIRPLEYKGEHYDEFVEKGHVTGVRDTAKMFGIKLKTFTQYLIDNDILFRQGASKKLMPKAPYDVNGWFEVKNVKNSFNDYTTTQTFFTVKGQKELQQFINKHPVE